MVHLSILVPATGTQAQLDDTLVSVLENRPADCEVILVHPPAYEDPYDLGDEVRLVRSENLELLPLVNDGLAACQGQLIHLLCAGSRATSDWCQPVLNAFRDDRNLAAVVPRLTVGRHGIVRGVAYDPWRGKRLLRRRSPRRPLMPTLQAGFYQTSALRFMKGFDIRYQLLAEVELGLRLRAAGYKTVACDESHCQAATLPTRRFPLGFQGGQLRERLRYAARRAGLKDRSSPLTSLLGEIPLHLFRPSAAAAMAGRIGVRYEQWASDPSPLLEPKPRVPEKDDSALRKAG